MARRREESIEEHRLRQRLAKAAQAADAGTTSASDAAAHDTAVAESPSPSEVDRTHTPDQVHIPPPAPREHMQRTQMYLRPDQIRWLDHMAKRTGRGVTRSDWLRYAVDELMRRLRD